MAKEKVVVILSGGLDSTILTYYLKNKDYDVYTLSFNYGQKHNIELEKAKTTCDKLNIHHKIIDMKFMKELIGNFSALTSDKIEVPTIQEVIGQAQPITYVPNRNMIMLAIATSYAESIGAEIVCFGAQKHDEYSGYWDTTQIFRDNMNKVNKLNREHQIQIKAPFVLLSKYDEVALGKQLKVPFEDTHTCYKGTNCGTCPTCADRISAFATFGIPDSIKYEKEINWNELIQKKYKSIDVDEIVKKVEKELQ